jgi:hypothetical protein
MRVDFDLLFFLLNFLDQSNATFETIHPPYEAEWYNTKVMINLDLLDCPSHCIRFTPPG